MGDSERRQLKVAEDYCARNGLELVDSVSDRGISAYHGAHRERTALGRLLKLMKRGDVLLIGDTDRWGREDPLDALTKLQEQVRKGIEVVFLRTGARITAENFGDMGTIVPVFFGAPLASQESKKKGERIAAAWEAKRAALRAGKPVDLRLPCWLQWNREMGKAEVIEERAAVVRTIFALAAEGHGWRGTVRLLRDTPTLTSRRNARWNPSTIGRLLKDKAVLGYATLTDPPVPGVWPAIVSEELFFAAAARAKGAKRITAKAANTTNLFTGLLKCSRCGSNLVVHRYTNAKTLGVLCSRRRYGTGDCGHSALPLGLLEKSVLAFLADGDVIRPLLTGPAAPSKLDELEGRLAAARKQAEKLSKLIIDAPYPLLAIYGALKAAEKQVGELAAAHEEEARRVRAERPAADNYQDFIDNLPSLAADPGQRPALRRAVAGVVDRIVVNTQPEPGTGGGRRWSYEVLLKGATEPVLVTVTTHPETWIYRRYRPELTRQDTI